MSLQNYTDIRNNKERPISIAVKIREIGKTFYFTLAQKTKIKEISLQLSELLNLDILRTNYSISLGYEVLNPASTLLQNKVRSGDLLIAKMLETGSINIKTPQKTMTKSKSSENLTPEKYIDVSKYQDYRVKQETDILGLKLVGVCENSSCVANEMKVTIPVGTGVFKLTSLLKETKCMACKRSVKVKELLLTNCFWKVEGKYYDSNGFCNTKYMKGFYRADGTPSDMIYQKLRETEFIDPKITVKAL